MPWCWQKLNNNKNPSSAWEGGAGLRIREYNLPTPSSPMKIPTLHWYAPPNWLAEETQGSSYWPVYLSFPLRTLFLLGFWVAKSCLTLFVIPWTVACQTPLSMGFSRQEYWSGLPFPSPEDLPNPGIEPTSPALQVDSTAEPPGKLLRAYSCGNKFSF